TNLERRTLDDRGIPYHGRYRMRGRSVTDEYVGPQKRLAWQRYRQGPRSHFEGIRALSLLHNVYSMPSRSVWSLRFRGGWCSVANNLNPLALKLVVAEAEALLLRGEALGDVLEAFAELLIRP